MRSLVRENEQAVKPRTDEAVSAVLFQEFDAAMSAFGPFEPNPDIAVAVSGGSDSMALILLVDFWVRVRGGRVIALTVNHGLREETAFETRIVKEWMQKRRIEHKILDWNGEKPKTNLQSQARNARYKLIDDWCRDHRILHVLVGHTANDQAETYLMRLRRQSNLDGLAGMSAIRELVNCRLLRPLLSIKREDLRKFLSRAGQKWLDDPSNSDRRYERTEVRNLILSGLFSLDQLWHSASNYGRLRIALEHSADQFIASSSRLNSAGYIAINRSKLRTIKSDTAIRVLGRAIAAAGGSWHFPPQAALRSILSVCGSSVLTSRTLGGCRIIASSVEVIICRESRNLPEATTLVSGLSFLWDRRIFVSAGVIPEGLWQVTPAANQVWSKNARDNIEYMRWRALPLPIRATLPVLTGPKGIFSAPLLAYNGSKSEDDYRYPNFDVKMAFRPCRPLSVPGFCLAN